MTKKETSEERDFESRLHNMTPYERKQWVADNNRGYVGSLAFALFTVCALIALLVRLF